MVFRKIVDIVAGGKMLIKKILVKLRNKLFLNAVREIVRKHQEWEETYIHHIVQFGMDLFMEIREKSDFSHNFKALEDFEAFCTEHEQTFRHDHVHGMVAKFRFSEDIQTYKYHGFCSICNKDVDFICDSSVGTHIEGLLCPECRQNVRLRMMYNAVLATYCKGMRVYASEYVTGFFSMFAESDTRHHWKRVSCA